MKILSLLLALSLAAAATSSGATPLVAPTTTFDFSNLEYLHGVSHGLLPKGALNSAFWHCTGGDVCGSDIDHGMLGGELSYLLNGITVTATGEYRHHKATVIQDHDNGWNPKHAVGAGLGVYHKPHDNSDDNVTVGETLKLHFSKQVTLSGLDFRADGHNRYFDRDATFLLDGLNRRLRADIDQLHMNGTDFSFAFGGREPEQFYLSGVTVSAVPEPATWLLLLGGIGMLGWSGRHRRA